MNKYSEFTANIIESLEWTGAVCAIHYPVRMMINPVIYMGNLLEALQIKLHNTTSRLVTPIQSDSAALQRKYLIMALNNWLIEYRQRNSFPNFSAFNGNSSFLVVNKLRELSATIDIQKQLGGKYVVKLNQITLRNVVNTLLLDKTGDNR